MITAEQCIAGTDVTYRWNNEQTATKIIEGSYVDPSAGLMLKTELHPGGMTVDRYSLTEITSIQPAVERKQETPLVFEVAILDEKEPVQLTPELIREKSKSLTDMVIENIFDVAGYDKVKSAKNRAVKTRTSIEKIEKSINAELKADFDGKKKKVSEYTAGLYEACREVENALQGKLTAIDEAKEAEVKRLDDEKRERTEAREAKMFELGMTWNGHVFAGYSYSFSKETLHGYTQDFFANLVVDIAGRQMEQSFTGEVHSIPAPVSPILNGQTFAGGSVTTTSRRTYDTAVFEREIFGTGLRIVLTKGVLAEPDADAVITNARVMESAIYVQVVK